MNPKTPSLKKLFISHLEDTKFRDVAERLLNILSFPDVDKGLGQALGQLTHVVECLRSILPEQKILWDAWYEALPRLIQAANESEAIIAASIQSLPGSKGNRVSRKLWQISKFPLLSLIAADAEPEAAPYVLTMKSILFATQALNSGSDFEQFFAKNCDDVRLGHKREHRLTSTLEKFPAWLPGTVNWAKQIEAFTPTVIHHEIRGGRRIGGSFPSDEIILASIKSQYQKLRDIREELVGLNSRNGFKLKAVDDADLTTDRTLTSRPSFRITTERENNPHADQIAGAPRLISATSIPDTSADVAPSSITTQHYEIRYTNFRTRLQKQFLPYAWEVLNPFEIGTLINSIFCVESEYATGATLIWLMLVTGLPLEDILSLTLAKVLQNRAGIDENGTWCRIVPSPRSAFVPNERLQKVEPHGDSISLSLPVPRPQLLQNLLSNIHGENATIRTAFHCDSLGEDGADLKLREFLAHARLMHDGRYTLGRVQRTLAAYLMGFSGDPVIIHILTGLATDIPPVGMYYAAFESERIQTVYQGATEKILRA
jgi:hypothetical protein